MDRFASKLESIYKASGGKKINIISHSMGGLLVKCFMALHSDVKSPCILISNIFIYFLLFLQLLHFKFVDLYLCNMAPLGAEIKFILYFFLQVFEKYVKNWIAIAAPFQGMQKI